MGECLKHRSITAKWWKKVSVVKVIAMMPSAIANESPWSAVQLFPNNADGPWPCTTTLAHASPIVSDCLKVCTKHLVNLCPKYHSMWLFFICIPASSSYLQVSFLCLRRSILKQEPSRQTHKRPNYPPAMSGNTVLLVTEGSAWRNSLGQCFFWNK